MKKYVCLLLIEISSIFYGTQKFYAVLCGLALWLIFAVPCKKFVGHSISGTRNMLSAYLLLLPVIVSPVIVLIAAVLLQSLRVLWLFIGACGLSFLAYDCMKTI